MMGKALLTFPAFLSSCNRTVIRQYASIKAILFPHGPKLLSSWSVFGRRPNVASDNVNIYFRVSHFVTHTRTFSYMPIILPILIRYFIPNIFHLFLKFCFGMTRIMVQHTYPKQFLKQKIQKFNWSKATTTWFHDGFWHCKGENGQTQTDKKRLPVESWRGSVLGALKYLKKQYADMEKRPL